MQRYEATAHESRCECCGPRVKFDECHDGDWVRHDDAQAEIASLRAELDAAIKALGCGMGHGLESGASLAERIETREAAHREYLDAAKADLASARAALDKEREACDEARRLVGVPNPFDPKWNEDMRAWCDRYSARRAALPKEPR